MCVGVGVNEYTLVKRERERGTNKRLIVMTFYYYKLNDDTVSALIHEQTNTHTYTQRGMDEQTLFTLLYLCVITPLSFFFFFCLLLILFGVPLQGSRKKREQRVREMLLVRNSGYPAATVATGQSRRSGVRKGMASSDYTSTPFRLSF